MTPAADRPSHAGATLDTIFRPWRLGPLEVPNRLVRSATEEGLSTEEGAPTQRLIDLTAELARGGAGLIVAGSAFISREGRGATNVTGIDDDALIEPLSRLCAAVHDAGGILAAQLLHSGSTLRPLMVAEKAGPYGPSAMALDPVCGAPVRALTTAQIGGLVDDYARAAARARRAGFDAVQIHAAHGYLINQFLSPARNHREDAYGGSLQHRARLLYEVYEAVRAARRVRPDPPAGLTGHALAGYAPPPVVYSSCHQRRVAEEAAMPTRHRMSSVSALILIALVVLLLPLLGVPVAAAAPGDTLWSNTYSGGAKADAFVDVARAPGGDLYAVGAAKATEEVSKLLLVKFSPSGAKLWARTYTWPGRPGAAGAAVAVTSAGRVVVAGSIGISPLSDPRGRDMVVLSYTSAGVRKWVARYDGTAHKDDYPTGMVVDGAGSAYVVGASTGKGTGLDYAEIKVSGAGGIVWKVRYAGPAGFDYPNAIAIDAGRNTYLTGSSAGKAGAFTAATLKVSSAGKRTWVQRLQYGMGITHGNDIAFADLGGAGGKSLYLTGATMGGMGARMNLFVSRLRASDGAPLAEAPVDTGGDEVGFKLAVDGAGDAYAVGDVVDAAEVRHALIAKVTSWGAVAWTREVSIGAATDDAGFQAVAVNAAGTAVYCGGYGRNAGGDELLVVKVAADNTMLWMNHSAGTAAGGDNWCRSLLLGPAAVYTVGQWVNAGSGIDALIQAIEP